MVKSKNSFIFIFWQIFYLTRHRALVVPEVDDADEAPDVVAAVAVPGLAVLEEADDERVELARRGAQHQRVLAGLVDDLLAVVVARAEHHVAHLLALAAPEQVAVTERAAEPRPGRAQHVVEGRDVDTPVAAAQVGHLG